MLRAIPRKPLPRVLEERVAYVKRQAQRVLDRKREKARHFELKGILASQVEYNRALKKRKLKSRADEMEDRWLGPLAPIRAVSEREKQLVNSISQDEQSRPRVTARERIKYWNIVPKDRVLILKGADKHKIGVVKQVFKDNNTVVVEGMNMVNIELPHYILEASRRPNDPAPNYTYSREMPIALDDIRLVYPLPCPETGTPTDTVIAELETVAVYYDRETGYRGWKRAIKGDGIVIPWPKGEKKELETHDADTRRMDVDRVSFNPTLFKEPFPGVVMDELRNKYSKFRTRHDAEYIEKMWAKEKAKKGPAMIRTPLQELNRKIRLGKKALGKPELPKDILERIGRVMAQNKPTLLGSIRNASQQDQGGAPQQVQPTA
ncbi:hypothetical protein L211DRAFT_393212 [Terfezia boudieri ATCC MYA-4762]|uniref:KOW domain-containing protein n=1 Tax=Terfezia boudieri ATCC MYA-4762 TaxID=1051890 RepID=A0A3N4MJG5_9PEZI|nr:hypothetical protein L211DRAFT_393212 [Terfezia boudieri ATCC MYA-4762]